MQKKKVVHFGHLLFLVMPLDLIVI